VVDFFDFGFGNLRWPIFNFADSFVTVGVGLLFLGYWRREEADTGQDAVHSSPEEEVAQS